MVGRLLGETGSKHQDTCTTQESYWAVYCELRDVTLLTKFEGEINAGPLTHVYDVNATVSYPLTPGQLITMSPNNQHHETMSTYEEIKALLTFARTVYVNKLRKDQVNAMLMRNSRSGMS